MMKKWNYSYIFWGKLFFVRKGLHTIYSIRENVRKKMAENS